MRIAQVLATSTGGVGRHVHSLSRALVAGGDRVAVLGPAATEELFGFTAVGARFAPVQIASGPRPVADARAVARLRGLVRGADVVHAHGLRAGLVAALALAGRRTPLVVTWHNQVLASGLRARVAEPLERVVARGADVTLGASTDLVDRVRALGGRDVRLAPVAAPPLPEPAQPVAKTRAALGVADAPVVLAVGRLHPQKGYDVLIEAAARWADRDPAPVVLIAGDGPLEAALTEQIRSVRAPVRLLGRRTDVAELLAAADVVVLPSRWEARSLTAQEAMRAGRPLVTTTVGGLPGLVRDAALLVPPDDRDALVRAVSMLLDDPAEASRLATRGQAVAATWPTEADTVREVAATYHELRVASSG
jgi:glycosyltransferase involved in cell wall biosynthesis